MKKRNFRSSKSSSCDVEKHSVYRLRAHVPCRCISNRSCSLSLSRVSVADIGKTTSADQSSVDSRILEKYGTQVNDDNDEEGRNDVDEDDCSSSTSSGTRKLVIDESYEDEQLENEHEKEIEKAFEVTCHRLKEKSNCEQSSPSSSAMRVTISKKNRVASNLSNNSGDEAENLLSTGINRSICSKTSSSSRRQKKSFSTFIYKKLQHVLRQNIQLRKKIKYYKKHWMRKPTGDIAAYLNELGTTLSNNVHSKQQQKKKKMENTKKKNKIKSVARVLNLTPDELYFLKHPKDITKTCRALIKLIYPDPSQRATMLITKIPINKLRAIHSKKQHQNNIILFFLTIL
ncbi:unnamed protein product, partial [Rotaria sp. Silwood2]